jgi:hypothetical protein
VKAIGRDAMILSNKARYIQGTLEDTIDLRRKTKAAVSDMLTTMEFDALDDDSDFKYLVRMPMDSVTEENASRILRERDTKRQELAAVQGKSPTRMWVDDLKELSAAYEVYRAKREDSLISEPQAKKKGTRSKKKLVLP